MESLRENKPLLWSLVLSALALLGLLSGSSPEFNEHFGLVEIPTEFKLVISEVLVADFLLALAVDRTLQVLLGSSKLKVPS
ncbi:hypothetical protein WISP_26663 [Willisornis vidua]|uniref:Uncharacterized protein n=1 Tax=Willisornis vidua TaxID=1566151 RepID=A0ABQ9DS21_9PASS|nr:hypothetical protein WISP_26663 [Willisornis vidua]